MCRDELIIKLRAEFNNHIRPIKINSQCEFCGSCDDLHLHHIDTFSNLLDETLEDLKINIYSENFTDSEVENINNIMLGKQLRSRFTTLCKNCHKEVHFVFSVTFYENPNKLFGQSHTFFSLSFYELCRLIFQVLNHP